MSEQTLKATIQSDLHDAMRARDKVRAGALRMALTSITNEEVSGKQARELSDDDIIGVLSTEAKKRREASTAFADGGRQDSAERELAEAAVIADYLPAPLTDEEVSALVAETIASLGVADEGMKAMGRVMGVVTPQVKGRADGGAVAAEVRRQLG
jgi:hypothetical protein